MKTKRLLALLCVLLLLAVSLAGPALADAAIEPWWSSEYNVDYYVYITSGDGRGLTPHDGPGSNYWAYDKVIPDGTRVHITKEFPSQYGNKWGYVEDDAYWGWIYLHDTSTSPVETWDVDYTAWILTDDGTGLNIRSGPDVRYDKIDGLIPDGTKLHVLKEGRLGNGKTWGYVEYNNGKRGWLTLTYVTKTPPVTVSNPIPAPANSGSVGGAVSVPNDPVPNPVDEDEGIGTGYVEPDTTNPDAQLPDAFPVSDQPALENTPAPESTASNNSNMILMIAILGASVICLSLAACLLAITMKKKKNQQ